MGTGDDTLRTRGMGIIVGHISLQSLTLTSGKTLTVRPGVLALVGPNNSGKSTLLRELRDQLVAEPYNRKAVSQVVLEQVDLAIGAREEVVSDLNARFTQRPPGQYSEGTHNAPTYKLPDGEILRVEALDGYIANAHNLGSLGHYFVTYLNAETRLSLGNSVQSYDVLTDHPTSPLQILHSKPELEKRLNDLTNEAFDTSITVTRQSGSMIHLLIGRPTITETIPPSEEFVNELRSLPRLEVQGDGVRALVGMSMALLTMQSPLILIDEPEAFLHPPQARIFGQFLASYSSERMGSQVIVATHSQDIIAGLTSKSNNEADIAIARISRTASGNDIYQLESDSIKRFVSDPLLKYNNMFDGLFSTGVVLCEGDPVGV